MEEETSIRSDIVQSISPETFHLRLYQERQRVDWPFMVVFLVNLLIVVCLQGSVFLRQITAVLQTPLSKNMLITICIPAVIAIALLAVIFLIMLVVPLAYITVCYVMASICTIVSGALIIHVMHSYVAIILFFLACVPIVLLILGRKQLKLSGLMCQEAASIMIKNPGSFGFLILTIIPSIIITDANSVVASYISFTNLSGWYYVYLGLSFLWLNEFLLYLGNYVFSGLTFTHYFLKGTVRYPGSPVFAFVRHAFRSSFGTVALSALLTPYLVVLRLIPPKWICCASTKFSELGLIYSAAYGYSLSEGTKRYDDMRRATRLDTLLYKSLVNTSGFLVSCSLGFVGAMLGLVISLRLTQDSEVPVVVTIFTAFLTYFTSRLLTTAVGTIADSLYILFGGAPSQMNTSHPALCQALLRAQREELHGF